MVVYALTFWEEEIRAYKTHRRTVTYQLLSAARPLLQLPPLACGVTAGKV
jgi:hypothetical protein